MYMFRQSSKIGLLCPRTHAVPIHHNATNMRFSAGKHYILVMFFNNRLKTMMV